MYLVGKVVGTHGIKGELKVKADTSFDRFKVGNILYLRKKSEEIEIKITTHRKHKDFDLIRINDYNNINEVLDYVGSLIYTTRDENELDENEYYYDDIIDKKVYDLNNNNLGDVVGLREVPQGIILEIKIKDEIKLVPFVAEFIKEVTEDKIIISPIKGLLWESMF